MHLVAFMGAICGEGRGNWEVRFIMRTFEGVRVIDFTQAVAGPFATYQLALQGADVVKVEQPGAGDQGRQMYRLDADFQKLGYSAIFLCGNAGKRSLTLDLKHPDARAVVHRLVRDADVVIENFKAGTMDRMGFGWNDLKQLNPKLVYCSISGFGQTGPRAAAAHLGAGSARRGIHVVRAGAWHGGGARHLPRLPAGHVRRPGPDGRPLRGAVRGGALWPRRLR